jgi:deoxyadenosine kinase
MNLPVYYEVFQKMILFLNFTQPVIDNEYLADFYKDPKKYSFNLQVYLLNVRFKQHQQIIWNGQGGVQDRTIYEDSVFAKMLRDSDLMEERDYRCYISLFANISNFMKMNTLIVHLDVTPEESLERIKMRSRDIESSVSIEYLRSLHAAYDEFLLDISKVIPVIRVNWNKFRTAEEMAKVVHDEWKKLSTITYVDLDKN